MLKLKMPYFKETSCLQVGASGYPSLIPLAMGVPEWKILKVLDAIMKLTA